MKRAITSLMLLVALLAGMLVHPVGLSAAPRIRRVTVAPGIQYIRKVYPRIPLRVHIITIDPAYDSTLDTVLATDTLPGLERTTSMAKRSGAIVAINGDFAKPSGRPVHLFAEDGRLMQTALSYGRNFAMTRDETHAYFGPPKPRVYATELDGLLEHPIGRVNDLGPKYGEIVMYTPESAGLLKPRENSCVARLYPDGPTTMSSEGVPRGRYEVDAVRCSEKPLARLGGTLLIAQRDGSRADEFAFPYISPGEQMDIGWTVDWPTVGDTIGGNPLLIVDGKIPWDELSGPESFLARHPRTGIGVTETGQVILMVIDGRRPNHSIGATLVRFAKLFRDMGAVWALNLDGGGSSTMVINGAIVNHPPYGERYVSSSLVVLPGADPGEASPDPEPEPEPGPGPEDPLLLTDPASTGGLADYLVTRNLPGSRTLARIARTFEASRAERSGR